MVASFTIDLPLLHSGQVKAYNTPGRFKVGKCGRRWGKSELAKTIISNAAINGKSAGYFAPSYKLLSEVFVETDRILRPICETSNKTAGIIRTITNGRCDFWSLENEAAGRSRKYHTLVIDEAAFAPDHMMKTWEAAIRPTLLDYRGTAWVFSTPHGEDPDNFFWRCCEDKEFGFVTFHAPTWDNPHLPADEIEILRKTMHPLMFRQEIEAEFVDWRGVAFFALSYLLHEGNPVSYPFICDGIYAIIDTAVKTGKEHDGTAVVYFSFSNNVGFPVVILDWDILQISGDLLIEWLPTVFTRCDHLAKECRAMGGVAGVFAEDKQTGTVLIQQGQRQGYNIRAIDAKLTLLGKDERAINVSGYVYNNLVKISEHAYNKETEYKGQIRNHFVRQVTSFRVGDEEAAKRADDLLDDFVYGIALACGNSEAF
jgi:hypothetical protein